MYPSISQSHSSPFALEPVALENTLTGVSLFERANQRKRLLRPFHVGCQTTKRRVCYCNTSDNGNQDRVQEMMIVSDLINYYDGYEPDFLDRMQSKVSR